MVTKSLTVSYMQRTFITHLQLYSKVSSKGSQSGVSTYCDIDLPDRCGVGRVGRQAAMKTLFGGGSASGAAANIASDTETIV